MSKKVIDLELFKEQRAKSYEKRIHIGNGQYIIFTSKKELNQFSTATRKYFWNVTTELNQLYIDIHGLYREVWLVSALSRKYSYDGQLEAIVQTLAIGISWLEKLCRRLRQTTEPSYITMNATQAITFFIEAATLIEKIFTRAQMISRSKVTISYIERLHDLKKKVDEYNGES
ncbi:MAG: hypothetical protein K2X48_07635 [Chitinophagaceae bacterium]|nr:hypothetical protein [Chitinophagaceae bacterium]